MEITLPYRALFGTMGWCLGELFEWNSLLLASPIAITAPDADFEAADLIFAVSLP